MKADCYLEKLRPFATKNLTDGKVSFLDGTSLSELVDVKFFKRDKKHKLVKGMMLKIDYEERIVRKRKILFVTEWQYFSPALLKNMLIEHGLSFEEMQDKGEMSIIIDGKRKKLSSQALSDVYALHDLFEEVKSNFTLSMCWYIENYFSRRAKLRNYPSVQSMIMKNPYILDEIPELIYNVGTHIAKMKNIDVSFETLINSRIANIISKEARRGNSYMPIFQVASAIPELKKDKDKVAKVLETLHSKMVSRSGADLCISTGVGEETSAFYEEYILKNGTSEQKNRIYSLGKSVKTGIYAKSIYFAEYHAAKLLADRISKNQVTSSILDFGILKTFNLNEKQIIAVRNAINYKVSILIGMAGSGKTHTIAALVKVLQKNSKKVMVLAPSAIAASNTGNKANAKDYQTIHRFARVIRNDDIGTAETVHAVSQESTVDADYLIVDEMSMNSIMTFCELLYAIKDRPNIHLVLIGDTFQLTAIGPCGHFMHMAAKVVPTIPVVELKRNYRSDDTTDILKIATGIREKNILDKPDKNSAVHILSSTNDTFSLILQNLLEQKIPFEEILILSDRRTGDNGTNRLNVLIRKQYFKNILNNPIGNTVFFVGDKVIAKQNDYASMISGHLVKMRHPERKHDIYNGMRGVIKSYDCKTDTLIINYQDFSEEFEVPYKICELELWIEIAYAVTVHKAQGCEAKYVLFILSQENKTMKQNMLYTALTRAKKEVFLFGSYEHWAEIAGNRALPSYSKFGFLVNKILKDKYS